MTYAARLQYLELQSLEKKRLNQDLIMCYKIVRGMVDVNLSDFFLHCLVLSETVVTAPTIDILKSLLMKLELPIV